MAKTKPLSAKTLEALKADLINRDYLFASRLHSLQDTDFPRRLKNIGEWVDAEKIKRLILGLHDNKTDVSGTMEITLIRKIIKGEAKDASG